LLLKRSRGGGFARSEAATSFKSDTTAPR